MKKATYTLTIEYANGDESMLGGLTHTGCYRILDSYEREGFAIKRWKISSGWQYVLGINYSKSKTRA